MRFPKRALLALAVLAFVGSACSSGATSVSTDAESAGPAQTSQDSAEPTESEPEREAEPETATVSAATPEPATPAPQVDQVEDTDQAEEPADFNGGGSGDWCEVMRGLDAEVDEGLDPRLSSGDPVQLEAYYQEQREQLEAMQRIVPQEIASDMAIFFETNLRFIALLEVAEWDFAKLDNLDSSGIDAEAEAEALDQAVINFQDYNLQACGIAPRG